MLKYFFSFLCLLFVVAIHAQQYPLLEKKITIESKAKSIPTQLELLREKADVGIIFSPQLFDKNDRKELQVSGEKLGDVLLYLLAGQDINFRILGQEIVLFKELPNDNVTVSGFIREKESGEGIISAAVVQPFLNKGTYTNAYGFYSLTLPKGFHKIKYYSFSTLDLNDFLFLEKDTLINQQLETTLTLSEVIVIDRDSSDLQKEKEVSREKTTAAEVIASPALGGESDLVRTAFMLPGVQSGGDGLGGLFIRGGSLDQNLVLLDGVPVYNAAHIVGIFSIFNSDAIRSSELYKGATPSRFGGRLSSVLDVRTKEGNQNNFNARASVGLISAKATIEGPLKKEGSAFLVSYRRSLLDLYLRPITRFSYQSRPNGSGFSTYVYQDLNVKVNSTLNPRDKVFLSFYFGEDRYVDNQFWFFDTVNESVIERKEGQRLNWGNTIGSIRWNHIYGNRVFSNTTFNYSRYNFELASFFGRRESASDSLSAVSFNLSQYLSSIEDFAIRQDFEFFVNPNHEVRFGASAILHRFNPNLFTLNETNGFGVTFDNGLEEDIFKVFTTEKQVFDGAVYIEDEFKIKERFSGNVGLRATLFDAGNTTYSYILPRVKLNYKIKENWDVFGALDFLQQPLHLLQRSGIGLPSDIWVPSADSIPPSTGWQVVLGSKMSINEKYEIGVEAYYKKLNNLIQYEAGASLESIDSESWQSRVTSGVGFSRGLEFWFRKKIGETNWSFNYTWAKSDRQFRDIAQGNIFPFRYDRRHFFKAQFFKKISDKWTFSGAYVYGTGNGVTLPTTNFGIQGNNPLIINQPIVVEVIDEINSFRMPDYHRLDVALNWESIRPKSTQRIQIGIFNVYNRQNPLYLAIRESFETPGVNELQQFSLIPILPSFSYSFEF